MNQRRPLPRRLLADLAGILLLAAVARPLAANPTSTDPNQPLDAHGTIAGAKELTSSLYQLYAEEEQVLVKMYDDRQNPERFSDRQIAKSAGRLWKARRDARHLKLMGEPAGYDLEPRIGTLEREIYKLGLSYVRTPKGGRLYQQLTQNLQRSLPKLNKFLDQADNALSHGKLEIFEQQMEAKGVELREQLVFFSPPEAERYILRFNGILSKGDTLLADQRSELYRQRGREAMQEQLNPAIQFAARAAEIRDQLATSGVVRLADGQELDGPAAFSYLVSQWSDASAGVVRATAIGWAFTNRSQVPLDPSASQLKQTAIAALATLIEATAETAPVEKLPTLYTAFLEEISVAERRSGLYSKELSGAAAAPLRQLASKDPAFARRVETYARATAEPLKWRSNFARQQAAHLTKGFPAAAVVMDSASEVTSSIRPNFASQISGQRKIAPPTLGEPVNWVVHEAATRLIGKPVSEENLVRLAPTSRTAIVPISANHYTNVAMPMPSQVELDDLRTAVLVSDQHRPLSYEAVNGISAAEMQDYLAVGGLVQAVHLEAMVTRLISLPNVASVLSPWGSVPSLNENVPLLQQACWRLDVQPQWAQHRYFTVRAAPTEN